MLDEWDPIGVRDVPEARDEYDSYIFDVYKLLVSGAPEQDIARYLYRVESHNMGLTGRARDALLPVAKALRRIDVSPRGANDSRAPMR